MNRVRERRELRKNKIPNRLGSAVGENVYNNVMRTVEFNKVRQSVDGEVKNVYIKVESHSTNSYAKTSFILMVQTYFCNSQ